jgi:predicted naringenin-chalcone synthase
MYQCGIHCGADDGVGVVPSLHENNPYISSSILLSIFILSKIISIGTAVPPFAHQQDAILPFMQHIYALSDEDRRKLKFLYHQSGIQTRYSVISDYSRPAREWKFYPPTENLEPFPSLEQRMLWYHRYAAPLSLDAIRQCLAGKMNPREVTHLITVSCTGMSAPGLDLELVELIDLPRTVFRTSVNFMGCYAALHALKIADAFCRADAKAKVLIVCTELCTLHFQQEPSTDNITSSLLFGDGSAAALIVGDAHGGNGVKIDSFYSEIVTKGKKDMTWELSATGFQMVLSSYIPDLIEEDFAALVNRALEKSSSRMEAIRHWCIHPGGRKILDSIHKSLHFTNGHLDLSYEVLKEYGNMSSPTILFVLQRIMDKLDYNQPDKIFGAAFGPGLTMETCMLTSTKGEYSL